jgi:hypothetical protein
MSVLLIAAVFAACFLLVRRWRLLTIYLLFSLAFTQNFITPLLYTAGITGTETSRALILVKEILLFMLFLYSAWMLYVQRIPLKGPRLMLTFFVGWCALRGGAALLSAEDLAQAGRVLRGVFVPLEIFTVGLAAALHVSLAERALRWLTRALAFLAVAALVLFALTGGDFWQKYANVGAYNVEVKGENPDDQIEDAGVSASGAGRAEFGFLSQFRAMGTFGDPISMAFALNFGILLLAFHGPWRWSRLPWLLVMMAALFVSFTRSAWVFLAVAAATVLLRRRRYGLLLALFLGAGLLISCFPAFAEFAGSSLDKLVTADPSDMHAAGLRGFYTEAWLDSGNLLGKGLDPAIRAIPESGYAFLVEHFGLPAYVSFVAFHLWLFARLSRRAGKLAEIAQATIPGTLVTMHTSQYPFSFAGYLGIWFLLGCASHALLRPEPAWTTAPRQPQSAPQS